MTTNRMGLERLSDERLELFISQPLDNGLTRGEQMELVREALACRKASKEPVAWTDEVELRGVEKDGCGYLFKANPITPHADPRRVIMLYAAPPLQAETVPDEMTPEMMRAVQLNSELGAYAASNLCGAYDLFAEFWKVACSAAMLKSVTNEP